MKKSGTTFSDVSLLEAPLFLFAPPVPVYASRYCVELAFCPGHLRLSKLLHDFRTLFALLASMKSLFALAVVLIAAMA